jgi:cytochrome c
MRSTVFVMGLVLNMLPAMADGDISKGQQAAKKCVACHSLKDAANKTGPSLVGVFGRAVASVEGYKYSAGMIAYAQSAGAWDDAKIDAYLANPKKLVPGGKMALAAIKKPEERANLIAYLKSLKP